MTAPDRRRWFASTRRGACALMLVGLLAAVGCKSRDGSSGGMAKNDPLIGGPGRIPKQNIPVPDRGTAGGPRRGDPLLGSPTGNTRAGSGYTEDPERFKKGPYIPGPGGSPAALAGRPRDDGEGLRIDDVPGGVPLTPAGGVLPPGGGAGPDSSLASDPQLGELAKYGVKRGGYSAARDAGQFVVRVKVPISEGGPVRQYIGTGPTEALAVKQVVEQIKADRK